MIFDKLKSYLCYSLMFVFFAICLGDQVSTELSKNNKLDNVLFEKLDLFAQVLSIIQNSFVSNVSSKNLIYGALQGTLSSLDPFSQFLTPDMYKEMQIDTGGQFGGLGVEIVIQDNYMVVVEPMPSSPAAKAGLKHGDKIIKINGEIVNPNFFENAISKLRGPVGSKVEVTLFRPSTKQYFTVQMIRENIKVQSITQSVLLPDTQIAYMKITKFQDGTSKEFIQAFNDLKIKNIEGLIIDLRNNPGGVLEEAILLGGYLVGANKLIVYTEGRLQEQNVKKYSKSDITPINCPFVILINKWTASAAEVVSGAVQDYKSGTIIGDTSYGKASVQSIIPLKDGSALRLTTAHYFTPLGRLIHKLGINPDIKVAYNEEDLVQLSDRIEKIKSGEVVKNFVYKDNQILTAIKNLNDSTK